MYNYLQNADWDEGGEGHFSTLPSLACFFFRKRLQICKRKAKKRSHQLVINSDSNFYGFSARWLKSGAKIDRVVRDGEVPGNDRIVLRVHNKAQFFGFPGGDADLLFCFAFIGRMTRPKENRNATTL